MDLFIGRASVPRASYYLYLYEHYDLLEYYDGYVYIFRACHWRLPGAHYLQAVAVQFAKQNNQ